MAPESQIDSHVFAEEMDKDSIRGKVQRRVSEYRDVGKVEWFNEWFLPVLEKAMVKCNSWEEILEHIASVDSPFGEEIGEFYANCLKFN